MFERGMCLHGLGGNFTALVRFRTEINMGFYRRPAIFGCVASRHSTRGDTEGFLRHLPQIMAGLG